jgi:hypothetical protein
LKSAKTKIWSYLLVPVVAGLFFAGYFSVVTFQHKFLAPGDALTYSIAAFYQQPTVWCDAVGCGMPVAADPQYQMWYPVLWLSRLLGDYNLLVLLAYVIAFTNAFAFSHALTRSLFAACIGGLVYSMSGFMFAHLGHVTIIHAACWLPLLMLSIEKLSKEVSWQWVVLGQFSLALTMLGGHSQVLLISLVMAAAFSLFKVLALALARSPSCFFKPCHTAKNDPALNTPWNLFWTYVWLCLTGLGLVAFQILPTLDLASLSPRADWSYENFVSFSLPPRQLAQFFFPFLFCQQVGYDWQNYARSFYIGEWSMTELAGYVGILPVILTNVGIVKGRGGAKWFWLATAVVSLILACGSATPLWKSLFHIPVVNHFRCPSRYILLFELSISVLASLGAASMERASLSVSRQKLCASACAITGGVAVTSFIWCQKYLRYHIVKSGLAHVDVSPITNSYVGVPLIFILGSFFVMRVWSRAPRDKIRQVSVLFALVLDLSSFAYFCEWRFRPASAHELTPPNVVTQLSREWHQVGHQFRVAAPLADLGGIESCPPNMNSIWSLPSPAFYSPLATQRMSQLLLDSGTGRLQAVCKSGDTALDIASVKYLIVPKGTKTDGPDDCNILSCELPLTRKNGSTAPRFVPTSLTDAKNIVYENSHYLPRFRFVYGFGQLNERSLLAAIHDDSRSQRAGAKAVNFKNTAIFESIDETLSRVLDHLKPVPSANSPSNQIAVLVDAGGYKALDVQTSKPGLLIISDQYFPEWSASVDGSPAELVRANHNFDAIFVDEGKHRVEMTFHPSGLGLMLSSLSLFFVIATALFLRFCRYPPESQFFDPRLPQ